MIRGMRNQPSITNQFHLTPVKLSERYAPRMIIGNRIADRIDFSHTDALSSSVAMKVNCDLQLTLMASSLCRFLGMEIGKGYQTGTSRHLFRDFVEATAQVHIPKKEIVVQFQKGAHKSLLQGIGTFFLSKPKAWLGGKRRQLLFGSCAWC